VLSEQQPPRDYRRRTAIEERHRQLKCFHDLTDFHSRSFNLEAAQVVFVLLSYTLRQWQLWKTPQEPLAGLHPDQIQRRLNLQHHFIVIDLAHAYLLYAGRPGSYHPTPVVLFVRERRHQP